MQRRKCVFIRGVGHCFGHRLKPASDMQNPLKRVECVPSALKHTLPIRR